jgi:hypothetical protein
MKRLRETFIWGRGDYCNHGAKVSPNVPSWLSPLPKDAPSNRLGLARWLTDPSHPLASRVTVNRYWQSYFGVGIVKTAEDFGSQGELPSHPELLDWLATEFVRTGWDIKAMQRLIVTSATYRQSSRVAPDLLEKDPENRLLARGPRFRMSAEMVRDNALSVSGLLSEQIGRPRVTIPNQGPGRDGFRRNFHRAVLYAQAARLYRRSMYTTWKRTVPPPHCPCLMHRIGRSNRPPRLHEYRSSLVLLNDPTYGACPSSKSHKGGRQ